MSIDLLDHSLPRTHAKPSLPHLTSAAVMEWIARAFDHLYQYQERARQRRQLMALDDHLLHDIGISRAEIAAEARKSFWQA